MEGGERMRRKGGGEEMFDVTTLCCKCASTLLGVPTTMSGFSNSTVLEEAEREKVI